MTHDGRSEEHTSELQSHVNLVCRLLLEKTMLSTSKATHAPGVVSSVIKNMRAEDLLCPSRIDLCHVTWLDMAIMENTSMIGMSDQGPIRSSNKAPDNP